MRRLALPLAALALAALLPILFPFENPAVFGAAPLPSAKHGADSEPELELTFGVYTSDKASTMYRQFVPVLEVLNERMGRALGRPVDIELRISSGYSEGIDALVNGDVDFARFGPASYVLAKERNPELTLLAMESKHGAKKFTGAIVTREDSEIESLDDLRGKRFAFGDLNSTCGRYLAQASLIDAGITGADLSEYTYLGRHDLVAASVQRGDFDAGAVKSGTLKKIDGTPLRVIAKFENVTKPWIGRSGLNPEVVVALREALLGIDDEASLNSLSVTGFLSTSDAEYEPTRLAIGRASEFD